MGWLEDTFKAAERTVAAPGFPRHVDVRAILANPVLRRRLTVGAIRALQAREGIDTTEAQAQRAYDKARKT